MKTLLKRSSAIFISLILIISVACIPANADSYVANWGKRGTVCTSLSSYATAYYTGSYSIATLSSYAGGTSQSNAPSSALYNALKSMMVSKHNHITSYDETRSQYKYTDCQNGNTSTISSFYSGTALSSTWDSGKTWNREHCWPRSKCFNQSKSQDSADIMTLRPTSTNENSSRGNTAYGKSSGYYSPNSESGGRYDHRGDVARLCLYSYTRWGNTGRMWGSNGVMESLTVLIEWMTVDPVDTWEMGRNDAVQSITGVRNVYVDFPELAFKLFGYAVPANYTSPSGKGSSVGGGGTVVTPPTTSTPTVSTPATSSKPVNVLDQVMGNNSNTNTNNNNQNQNVNINVNQNVTIDQSGNKVDTSKDYEVDIDECRHEVTVHKNEIPATCESAGMTAELLCDQCGLYISPGKEIPRLTHKPSADGVTCEYCGKDFTKVEIDFDNDFVLDTLTLWLIVGGAAMLIVIAGVVVTIVVVKKKKAKKAEEDFNLNK